MNYTPFNKQSLAICPKCGGHKDYRALVCNSCRCAIDTNKIPFAIKDIKKSTELGHSPRSERCGLVSCIICGKERWIRISRIRDHKFKNMCSKCMRDYQYGEHHPRWKGHRKSSNNYNMILVYPDSPYYCMAKPSTTIHAGGRYVLEHRLVMAQHIQRPLLESEHIHHLNGNKIDNHLDNLQLISPHDHAVYTHMCASCNIRKEIKLLKWQVKNLQNQLQYKLNDNSKSSSERVTCRKGHKLPKVAVLRKAEVMVCHVCQDCPDFSEA